MKDMARFYRKVIPEVISLLEERYNILRLIYYSPQPIGRRALSGMLNLGERVVRSQVETLKTTGLIEFSPAGMTLTTDGEEMFKYLSEYIKEFYNLTDLEEEVKDLLKVRKVVIVPGDSEQDFSITKDIGYAAAKTLKKSLRDNMIIAVSGGTTVLLVAEALEEAKLNVTLVPARGGLGESVENQANTIAAKIANKLKGRYKLLHLPDSLSDEALEVIMANDINVREVMEALKKAEIFIHGIGQAEVMAKRRSLKDDLIQDILAQGAVGEILGYYFDLTGKIIYTTSNVGLSSEDAKNIKNVIAVAGGKSKAKAIIAAANFNSQMEIIIDEAAAREILLDCRRL